MTTTSAAHIFDILREICAAERPLGATELSRALGLSLTTTHRGLATLAEAGYIERHLASARFAPGPMTRRICDAFFAQFPMRDTAVPYLQRLAVMSGETTSLFVRVGWYTMRIASLKGTNEVIQTWPIGEIKPLGTGAAGRLLAAYLPGKLMDRFLSEHGDGLDADALARIREAGLAIGAAGDRDSGHVAFPVVGADGDAFAALVLEGSVASEQGPMPETVESCRTVAAEFSEHVSANPAKYRDIFAHLDFGSLKLPVSA